MTFSQEIINVLNYLCEKFGIAIDWTSENVMPYLESLCEKYIRYEIFTSIAWIVIMLAITGIIAIPLSIIHKKAKIADWDFYSDEAVCTLATVLWVIFIAMTFASIIVVCRQVFDIIECYTFPEKVIFEYLQSLMSSVSK